MENSSETWFREEVRSAIRFYGQNMFSPIVVYRPLIKRFMMTAQRDRSMSEYGAEVESVQKNVHDDDRSGSAQITKDGCQHSIGPDHQGRMSTQHECRN
jgi:hypothetical protein